MIESAEEFIRLRKSTVEEEYNQSTYDEATMNVWLDVIQGYPDMKCWVVHNKTVPIEILELLASDEDDEVRFSVATKRKLTHNLFEKLAKDSDSSVRQQIALNRKVPTHILECMINDSAPEVVSSVKRRLGLD